MKSMFRYDYKIHRFHHLAFGCYPPVALYLYLYFKNVDSLVNILVYRFRRYGYFGNFYSFDEA